LFLQDFLVKLQGVDQHPFEPVDPERHRLLAGHSRVQVLEVLRRAPSPLTAPDIAAHIDLHPNTVRLHLAQLVEAGLVTSSREDRDRPGRPRLLFTAADPADVETRGSRREPGTGHELLADVLVGHLEQTATQPAEAAAAAGRAWGGRMATRTSPVPSVEEATSELTDLLDDLGFDPRTGPAGRTIELHRCPFRQVPGKPSSVVCGVHLGLMQGALAARGAPIRVTALDPFVTPQVCLARLDAAAGRADGRDARPSDTG
jgi:predicted ArsR family transcriptional regulator